MPSSRGLQVFAFFLLVQVFSLTDAQQMFSPPGSQYFGSQLREPPQITRLPTPEPEYHKNGPQSPSAHPEPSFSEADLVVLIGSDLQVPYPLYEQISKSFLESKDILVLLPNNTLITVSGFADLNDICKTDPEDTKVLISSDSMIPASIYLRIVLIQPEEIMVKLPSGEILPNEICQELFRAKVVPTTESGGQTYYKKVDEEDSFPFLVVNEPRHVGIEETVSSLVIPRHGTTDEYHVSAFDPSGILKPMPFYDGGAALVHQFPRPQPLPQITYPNSPVQDPGRGPRHVYREPVPRYQNRFLMPHSDPRRTHNERKVLLPPGIHVMDSARCGICDPASPDARIRILTV